MRRGQPHIAANGNHLSDPRERYFESDFLDDVGNRSLEQRHLQGVAEPSQVELLSKPDGAEGIHARAVRPTPAQQHQARTPPADFREQRPGALECGMTAKSIPNGEVHETALFSFVDDVKADTRASANPIEKELPIPRFADGTCRNRPNLVYVVPFNNLTEAVERSEGGIG